MKDNPINCQYLKRSLLSFLIHQSQPRIEEDQFVQDNFLTIRSNSVEICRLKFTFGLNRISTGYASANLSTLKELYDICSHLASFKVSSSPTSIEVLKIALSYPKNFVIRHFLDGLD